MYRNKDTSDRYLYRMQLLPADETVESSEMPDIIEILYPGYREISGASDRFDGRIDCAKRIQTFLRMQAVSFISSSEASSMYEWQWEALSRTGPIAQVPLDFDAESEGEWNLSHPLILIETDYAPFTKTKPPHPGPKGRIIWLRPSTEFALLTSLAEAGFIDFQVTPTNEREIA